MRGQPSLGAKSAGLGVRVAGLVVADSQGDLDLEVFSPFSKSEVVVHEFQPQVRCMILKSASVCP